MSVWAQNQQLNCISPFISDYMSSWRLFISFRVALFLDFLFLRFCFAKLFAFASNDRLFIFVLSQCTLCGCSFCPFLYNGHDFVCCVCFFQPHGQWTLCVSYRKQMHNLSVQKICEWENIAIECEYRLRFKMHSRCHYSLQRWYLCERSDKVTAD